MCGRLSNKAIEAICRDPEGDAIHTSSTKYIHGCHLDEDAWISRCAKVISLCGQFAPDETNLKSNYCKLIWKANRDPRREKLPTYKTVTGLGLNKVWGVSVGDSSRRTVAPVSINTLNTSSVSTYFSWSSKERMHSSFWNHLAQDFCPLPFSGAAINLWVTCMHCG